MKKILLLIGFLIGWMHPYCQTDTTAVRKSPWKASLTLGLNYNLTKLNNPPVGYGINQAGGNILLNIALKYGKPKSFFNNTIDWRFGLLRLGSGPLEAGSSQRLPYQKTLDRLKVTSMYGYRVARDSSVALLTGFDLFSQVTPSFKDANGALPGQFVRDIRNSSEENPIQSRFFSPTHLLAYVGIGYEPIPNLFIGFAPAAYKAILVLDENVASLVGRVDAEGLPEATVHGNPVDIVNGAPVFKKAFNQFGSYLLLIYNDDYWKKRISVSSTLDLYANYLENFGKIDVWWRSQLNLNIVKGLSLSYLVDLFYDYDILVALTDDDVPGGFTGELGRKVALERQFMLQYKVSF